MKKIFLFWYVRVPYWRRAEIVQKQTKVQIQTVPQSKLLICIMRKLRLITKEHTKVFSPGRLSIETTLILNPDKTYTLHSVY